MMELQRWSNFAYWAAILNCNEMFSSAAKNFALLTLSRLLHKIRLPPKGKVERAEEE